MLKQVDLIEDQQSVIDIEHIENRQEKILICEKKIVFPARLSGPGGLHNIGNLLALFGGMIVFTFNSWQELTFNQILHSYFAGSIGTLSLTLSMIIFLIAGEYYHRACNSDVKFDQKLLQTGDFLSAIAAFISMFALVSFGQTHIALFAGSLLVIGKLGTAIFPQRGKGTYFKGNVTNIFRSLSIISRIPSIAALAYASFMLTENIRTTSELAISLVMLVCYILWLIGDIMLKNLDNGKAI